MGAWGLLLLVTFTWILWAVGALQAHEIGKREGRTHPESHMSVVPIIPFFPLIAFGVAKAIDALFPLWGTWFVGGSHAALGLAFVVAIVWQTIRHRFKTPHP